jgi:hypothetical protein
MTATVAAHAFAALAVLAAAFHVALAAGAPWGRLTWGGRFPGRLPGSMRGVAVLSAALLVAFALAVAVRAGVLWPSWQPTSRKLVWGVVAYCALGVLANAFTPSRWERIVWLPVVAAMLVCSTIVALS